MKSVNFSKSNDSVVYSASQFHSQKKKKKCTCQTFVSLRFFLGRLSCPSPFDLRPFLPLGSFPNWLGSCQDDKGERRERPPPHTICFIQGIEQALKRVIYTGIEKSLQKPIVLKKASKQPNKYELKLQGIKKKWPSYKKMKSEKRKQFSLLKFWD